MVLTPEFKKMVEDLVKINLETLDNMEKESKAFRQIWKFEHEPDFFYGLTVGRIEGHVQGIFFERFKNRPSLDELHEIKEIIEIHSKEIREKIFGKKSF